MEFFPKNLLSKFRFIFKCRAAVRPVSTKYFVQKVMGYSSIGLALVKCQENLTLSNAKVQNLSHEQCIKQACLLSVNSASTLLTTTASALTDICNNYKESLNKILSLLEEAQTFDGENPGLWDAIVEARAEVNKAKSAVNELNSYMECVEKVVTSTTEAAFLAGAEYLCTSLCERLESTQREIRNQIGYLRKLEEDYLKMQQEIVSNKEKNFSKKEKQGFEVKANELLKA